MGIINFLLDIFKMSALQVAGLPVITSDAIKFYHPSRAVRCRGNHHQMQEGDGQWHDRMYMICDIDAKEFTGGYTNVHDDAHPGVYITLNEKIRGGEYIVTTDVHASTKAALPTIPNFINPNAEPRLQSLVAMPQVPESNTFILN